MRHLLWVSAVVLALLPSSVDACVVRDADTFFINDPASQIDANIPFVRRMIFFDDDGATLKSIDGLNVEHRLLNAGSAGTGIGIGLLYDPAETDDDLYRYYFIDLSKIAKDGAPDFAMIFDGELFWPECKAVSD